METEVQPSSRGDHGSVLLKQLDRMRAAEELTDVVLLAEGIPFPCHKVVLSAFSPYFQVKTLTESTCFAQNYSKANILSVFLFTLGVQVMFTCGLKETRGAEVPLRDTPARSLELLLNYMYRAELPLTTSNIQTVAAAAFLLHVDGAFRWVVWVLLVCPISNR